ncbi:MAG: transcription antitermination factor NusB [Thermostichales cyanobacterium DRC_bins_46]
MATPIQPRRIARELALLAAGQLSGLNKGKRLEDILVAAVRAVKEDVHDTLSQAAADLKRGHHLLQDSEQVLPPDAEEVSQLRQRLTQLQQHSRRLARQSVGLEANQSQQWVQELQLTLEHALEASRRLEKQLYDARQLIAQAAEQCQSGINQVGTVLTLPEVLMLAQGEEVKAYALHLLTALQTHKQEIDPLLESYLTTWSLARLGQIERSILRIAVLEMLILKSAPPPVAVHEAVELAKKYGSQESATFINGVLRKLLEDQQISLSS